MSVITSVSWAIAIFLNENKHCWIVNNDTSQYHWINDSFRLFMLTINAGILIHIFVTLWKTFSHRESAENYISLFRTTKASLIICISLGIPFLFFLVRPDTDSCWAEQCYYFISYFVEGLQGVFVSCFHCYGDREIRKFIVQKFSEVKVMCISYVPDHQRRFTDITLVQKSIVTSTTAAYEKTKASTNNGKK